MSEYTPTTDDVRFNYAMHSALAPVRMGVSDLGEKLGSHLDAFDRWLATHDAEVRAGVVTEEPEWEYGYRPTYAPMHPEHPGEPMPEIWPTNRKPDEFLPGMGGPYRRTKMTPAGPWVPVEN